MVKPKHGEYQCLYCQSNIEGKFSEDDTVFCYLCGNQMWVTNMVKIEKPKEVKSTVEPDLYALDPLSYTFTCETASGAPGSGATWIIKDGHGRIRTDLMI